MKTLVLSLLLASASFAHADNWSDNCAAQPSPEMVMHYPANIVSDVTSGKVTATVRKGVRCYKAGDILSLQDAQTKQVFGQVKVEEIIFSKFNSISPKVIAPAGEASMESMQNRLVAIYGESVRNESLTELYFSFVK